MAKYDFEMFEKILDAYLKPIDEKLDRLDKALYGNGKPGLVERVDCLEDNQKSILAKFGMFTAFFSLVGIAIFETVKEFIKNRFNL